MKKPKLGPPFRDAPSTRKGKKVLKLYRMGIAEFTRRYRVLRTTRSVAEIVGLSHQRVFQLVLRWPPRGPKTRR